MPLPPTSNPIVQVDQASVNAAIYALRFTIDDLEASPNKRALPNKRYEDELERMKRGLAMMTRAQPAKAPIAFEEWYDLNFGELFNMTPTLAREVYNSILDI